MEITLELAKELSERKWQAIVDSNGDNTDIMVKVPELVGMWNECAMCELIEIIQHKPCSACIYNKTVCERYYIQWLNNKTRTNAGLMLNAIKEANRINE